MYSLIWWKDRIVTRWVGWMLHSRTFWNMNLYHGVPGLSQFHLMNPRSFWRIPFGKRTSQCQPRTYNYTYTLNMRDWQPAIMSYLVFLDVRRLFFRGFIVFPYISLAFRHDFSVSGKVRKRNASPASRKGLGRRDSRHLRSEISGDNATNHQEKWLNLPPQN